MMGSKNLTQIPIGGKLYRFNPDAMIAYYNYRAKADAKKKKDIILELQEATNTSYEGVRSWLKPKGNNNGPDPDKIADIARVLGCDMMDLLIE